MVVAGTGSAQDLAQAKAVLLDTGRRRLSPEALRAALVDLHDFWLASRAAAIGLTDRAALVAVGALGRRELAPYSDLDLVLLHDGRKDIDRIADQLWYPLWDAGIGLDHSVRTPGQAVQVATTDLRAAFGLLEMRHIAGDPALMAWHGDDELNRDAALAIARHLDAPSTVFGTKVEAGLWKWDEEAGKRVKVGYGDAHVWYC